MCAEFVDKYRPTREKGERAAALFSYCYMLCPKEWATSLDLSQFSQQIVLALIFLFHKTHPRTLGNKDLHVPFLLPA